MHSDSIPNGYRSITPYLKLPNSERLVDFLKQAFGGIERGRLLRPDGGLLHAEIVVGDSLLMVHEAPSGWAAKPSTLYHYVENVDAVYERALEAGGTSLFEPTDMYFGDRVACIGDVSENEWWIAMRRENHSIEELQDRASDYLSKGLNRPADHG